MKLTGHLLPLVTVSTGKIATALIAVLTAIVASHAYGQTGLGVFAILRVAPAIFMVFTDPGFSHAIPYLHANRKIPHGALVSSAVLVYLVVSTYQILGWFILSPLVKNYLTPQVSLSSVYLISVVAPATSICIFIINILRANRRYNNANLILLISEVFVLITTVAIYIFIPDPALDYISVSLAFSSVASIVAAFALSWGYRPSSLWLYQMSIIIDGLRFGIRSQIGNAFQILNYRLDHLFIGFFLSADKVATYFVASKAIEFFRFFTASIVFVYEPRLASEDGTTARETVRRIAPPLIIVNAVLLLLGVVISPFLFPLLFGSWSDAAIMPLTILALGLAISGVNTLFGAFYLGQGRPGVTTLASAVGLSVTVLLSLLLIPPYQVIGAAVASSVTYSAVTATYLLLFTRGGLPPGKRSSLN